MTRGRGPAARAQVARILASWEYDLAALSQEIKQRAEHKVAGLPPVSTVDHQAMRAAFEVRYHRMVEEGEPKAESLKEVASKDDGDSDYLPAELSADGVLRVRQGYRDGTMPRNAEELRAKIKLLGHCHVFLRLKARNRAWLSDVDDRTFLKYIDYLLGRHVAGLVMYGKTHHPPWNFMLSCDHELRRKA